MVHFYLRSSKFMALEPLIDCNLGQCIWAKIEKSNKTGQDKKSLISIFACFLTAITKVSFLEGRLSTRLCLHPNCLATRETTRIPSLLN